MQQPQRQIGLEIASYQQALQWLYDRIDYEKVRPAIQSNPFRLDRIRQMLSLIGSPQDQIPAVHIAGTKGKGSTAAMLDSILRASGIRTGLFTSPHITVFEERMRVDGHMPAARQITDLVRQLAEILDEHRDALSDRPPTFFEVTTLLAWMFFQQQGVELAVLETGLGGRLDCTNVCSPLVTVVTSIGLDHTHILGDTLELIAAEKAGILKPGIPAIQGRLPSAAADVVRRKAADTVCPLLILDEHFRTQVTSDTLSFDAVGELPSRGLPIHQCFEVHTPNGSYTSLRIPLVGSHQIHNASLAVMAADVLRNSAFPSITELSVRRGLEQTWWPLRFEIVSQSPLVVLDAAHNPDAVAAVLATLNMLRDQIRPRVLVFAASADKDAESMLRIMLPGFDHVVLTRFLGNPRSTDPVLLRRICTAVDPQSEQRVSIAESPSAAISAARQLSGSAGLICITGSIFLAAEARALLCGETSPFAEAAISDEN